jgi:hypothetical protein
MWDPEEIAAVAGGDPKSDFKSGWMGLSGYGVSTKQRNIYSM